MDNQKIAYLLAVRFGLLATFAGLITNVIVTLKLLPKKKKKM